MVGDVVDEISTATGGGGLAGTASIAAAAPLGSAAVPQCLPAKSPTPVVDSDNDGVTHRVTRLLNETPRAVRFRNVAILRTGDIG